MSQIHLRSDFSGSPLRSPLSSCADAASCVQDNLGPLKFNHREASLDMEELVKFCENHGTTPQSTCLAVWLIVLYHMTGREDVLVDLYNDFAWNPLPRSQQLKLDATLKSATSPLELLSLRDLCTTQASHMEDNCNKRAQNDKGKHLFKALNNEDSFRSELDQVGAFGQEYLSHAHIHIKDGHSTIRVLWQDGLEDLDELTDLFNQILVAVLDHPDYPIQSLGNPSSRQLTLSYDNLAPAIQKLTSDYDWSIPNLLSSTCSDLPGRMAIDAWDGNLSYTELDTISDRWAKSLISRGFATAGPVIHAFHHSRWAIVAWLSVLKAGGKCVPIDVAASVDRLNTIIDATGCEAAICDTTSFALLDRTSLHLVTPNELEAAGEATDVTIDRRSTSRVAAIMFTSGSTGKPKGVVQTHRAIATSLVKVARALGVDENTRFLQFAPHHFDVSICEIFTPLVTGGCLTIPAPEDKLGQIAENINSMGVTHALLTPTVAKLLSPDQVPDLKSLSLGGESCSSQLRKTWSPHVHLNILYGTTETAVWDTIGRIRSQDRHDVPSVGYPIGSRVWVVHPNDWTMLSPVGVTGELCVQGPEIAEEYLGDPERTGEAFKTQPPWLCTEKDTESPCNRIYRTGDLGKILKDGGLQILGRMDRQIKINGQRIEPGEVEETLRQSLPNQLEVFVDSLHPKEGRTRLAAFFSLEESSQPAIIQKTHHDSAIHDAIQSARSVLPSSMIPTVIIPMTTFPLTPTNKINRQELQKIGLEFLLSSQTASSSPSHNNTESTDLEHSGTAKVEDLILDFLQSRQRGDDINDLRDRDLALKDTGIDSLDAVALASTLKEDARIDVSASHLLSPHVKMSDLAAPQQTHASADERALLEKELVDWTSRLDKLDYRQVRSVLLTGANGFLGQEILRELFQNTSQVTAICIVRGRNRHHSRERLIDTLRSTKWWNDRFEDRIEVWLGDLAESRAGLNGSQWQTIFGLEGQPRQVDVIIHNGARVNWLEPYSSLRNTNVSSTYEFLEGFLRSRRPPQLFYVSGGYLSGAHEAQDELVEKICRLPAYDQTKFVSEGLIKHVQSMTGSIGDQIVIFKPGFIIGSTEDGRTQTGDTLWRLVKACIHAGSYSQEDSQRWIPVAGVDSIASMLVDQILLTGSSDSGGRFQRVLDGICFQDMWDTLADMDIRLKPMEHHTWRGLISKDLEEWGKSHPLFPLTDWLEGSGGYIGIESPEECLISEKACHNARLAVRKTLEYLIRSGFFSKDLR